MQKYGEDFKGATLGLKKVLKFIFSIGIAVDLCSQINIFGKINFSHFQHDNKTLPPICPVFHFDALFFARPQISRIFFGV
jgi:hypothetical protein